MGSQPGGMVSSYPSWWSVKTVLWSSLVARDNPFNDIFGVGVSVLVAVGDGVAVNGFAASVCFASARAVLAREVSTPGGFTIGVGEDRLQLLRRERMKNPTTMEYKRVCFNASSVKKISLPTIIRREGGVLYIPN